MGGSEYPAPEWLTRGDNHINQHTPHYCALLLLSTLHSLIRLVAFWVPGMSPGSATRRKFVRASGTLAAAVVAGRRRGTPAGAVGAGEPRAATMDSAPALLPSKGLAPPSDKERGRESRARP